MWGRPESVTVNAPFREILAMSDLIRRLQQQLDSSDDGQVALRAEDLLVLLTATAPADVEIQLSAVDLQQLLNQAVNGTTAYPITDYMGNVSDEQGPPVKRPLIELYTGQIQRLADFAGDESGTPPEDQGRYSIQYGNGHSGLGMYVWQTEYPEDGAMFLDDTVEEQAAA